MPQITPHQLQEFLTQVEDDCRPRARFYCLIFLASTIATFGLLANSAAVIIGAMLVAPLMSAIIGVAVGVVLNRPALLRPATFALISGAALALATGALLSLVSPLTEPGSEMLGRVRPTLYDLWVAAAAGLAGAYSLLRARNSAALPGVAIATALVPPLVTSGIELRLLRLPEAMGAFLLFLSNMVAITCAGLAVFVFFGLHRYAKSEPGYRMEKVYGRWAASFVAVGILLAHSLQQVVSEVRTTRTVGETLRAQVRMIPGASVDRYELTNQGKLLHVRAVVATPVSVGPPVIAAAERLLTTRLKRPVRLTVRSVITKDADAYSYLQAEVPTPTPQNPLLAVEGVLREQVVALPAAELVNYAVRREGAGYHVTAQLRTPVPVDELLVRGIRNLLSDALGAPVELKLERFPVGVPETPGSEAPGSPEAGEGSDAEVAPDALPPDPPDPLPAPPAPQPGNAALGAERL